MDKRPESDGVVGWYFHHFTILNSGEENPRIGEIIDYSQVIQLTGTSEEFIDVIASMYRIQREEIARGQRSRNQNHGGQQAS